MANAKGCKASQIALAWLLAQGNNVIPIPGTKRVNYLLENIAAAEIALTKDEITLLSKSISQVSGTRYNEAGMTFINK